MKEPPLLSPQFNSFWGIPDRVGEGATGPLRDMVEAATSDPVQSVKTRRTFKTPAVPPTEAGPKLGTIQYKRPAEEIERVKEVLGVATYTKAGERTFDYFFAAECSDD